jgi:DNA-binding protein H-NS
MQVPKNLETLSFKQLSDLAVRIDRLKEQKYEQATNSAQDRLRDMLRKMADGLGVKPETLATIEKPVAQNGAHKRGGKQKVAVKYRDPSHPENTWTGRGRAPRWLSAIEKAGGKRDAYRIGA